MSFNDPQEVGTLLKVDVYPIGPDYKVIKADVVPKGNRDGCVEGGFKLTIPLTTDASEFVQPFTDAYKKLSEGTDDLLVEFKAEGNTLVITGSVQVPKEEMPFEATKEVADFVKDYQQKFSVAAQLGFSI